LGPRFLRAEGYDIVQGFLMSPPVPARAFAALLRSTTATHAAANESDDGESLLARLSASR
jgi:hypothetical protein